MATWSKTRVTEDGLKLNAAAVAANKSIDIYAAKGGTGDNLTLDTMPVTFDIAGVKQKEKAVIVTLQIDNKGAQSEQTFNRIALFARLDAGSEVKTPYAVVESDTLEHIPAQSSQYKVLRVDVILAYTGAENVTVTPTIQLGITEEQARVIVTSSIGDHDGDPAAHQVMAHNVNDTEAPKGNNGTIRGLLDGLANRIKAITGRAHWFDDPDITLTTTKKRLDALDNRVGTLDFIPNSRIGTTQSKIATLGYNGRFDKARLPNGVVYEQMLEDAIREALTWKELWRSYSGYTTTGEVIATLPYNWRECYIEHTVSGYKDDTQNLPIISREQVRSRDTFSWFGAKPEVYFKITSYGGVILMSRGAASDAYVYAIYYR